MVVNNRLLRKVTGWTSGKKESCSDHKIIIFNSEMMRQENHISNNDYPRTRYIIKNWDFRKFEAVLASNLICKFNCKNNKKIDQ
jgi:hypothetical protein